MANDQDTGFQPRQIHQLARPGAIPTPAGIFPVSPNGGGMRRKRRPLLDLRAHDTQVKVVEQGNLLETAWGIIANAFGGDWSKAGPEWREAATRWRDQYFAMEKPPTPGPDAALNQLQRDEGRQLEAIRAAAAAADQTPVLEPTTGKEADKDLDAMLVRLSALPPSVAQKEIPGWDGNDETFADACAAQWAKLNPGDGIGGPRADHLEPTRYRMPSTGQEGTMTVVVKNVPGLGKVEAVEHVVTTPPHTGGPIPTPEGPLPLVGERGPESSRGAIMDDDEPQAPSATPQAPAASESEDVEEMQNLRLPEGGSTPPGVPDQAPVIQGQKGETTPPPVQDSPPASELLRDTVRTIAQDEGIRTPDRVDTFVESLEPGRAEALAGAIEGTAHLRENIPSASADQGAAPEIPGPPAPVGEKGAVPEVPASPSTPAFEVPDPPKTARKQAKKKAENGPTE